MRGNLVATGNPQATYSFGSLLRRPHSALAERRCSLVHSLLPLIDNNVGSTSFLDELVYKDNNFSKLFWVCAATACRTHCSSTRVPSSFDGGGGASVGGV